MWWHRTDQIWDKQFEHVPFPLSWLFIRIISLLYFLSITISQISEGSGRATNMARVRWRPQHPPLVTHNRYASPPSARSTAPPFISLHTRYIDLDHGFATVWRYISHEKYSTSLCILVKQLILKWSSLYFSKIVNTQMSVYYGKL